MLPFGRLHINPKIFRVQAENFRDAFAAHVQVGKLRCRDDVALQCESDVLSERSPLGWPFEPLHMCLSMDVARRAPSSLFLNSPIQFIDPLPRAKSFLF